MLSDLSAPTLIRGIATWGIDELRGLVGFNRVPPDHNGAVGIDHVVSVFNHALQIFSKDGALLSTQPLDALFGTVAGTLPVDPNILYDAASDRFVYVSFEVTGFDNALNPGNDQIMLNVAVSNTGDPLDGWHVVQIPGSAVIGGVNAWSDFPGIAVDGEAIYISANMFSFDGASQYLGNRVWIIDKGDGTGGFYDGGVASFSVHDPIAEATDLTGIGVAASTLIPARIEGGANGASGVYLVSADAIKNGLNEVLQIIRIDHPLSGPTFTARAVNLGDINAEGALPQAPQLGTANTLASGDGRVWSGGAVEFDGKLYVAFDVAPKSGADAGQTTVHWVEVGLAGGVPSLIQQGDIGGEDISAAARTFMPSIAVNKDGTVLINFSASGPGLYAGAYYALRAAGDPSGAFGPAQTLSPGIDWYFRNRLGEGISQQTTNRWGDFSGASVDPSDGTTFWFFNMFADTRGSPNPAGQDGRWRLTIGEARATIIDFSHAEADADEAYYGGLGSDAITLVASAAGASLTFSSGATGSIVAAFAGGGTATTNSIEALIFEGSAGNDAAAIIGALAAAQAAGVSFIFNGGGGDDTLVGGVRRDTIDGGDGDDALNGAGSHDAIDGGEGSDLILGGTGSDTIAGGNGADSIDGGSGVDLIDGGGDGDRIFGGGGFDAITGGNGNDTLTGGAGKDSLNGGKGFDYLIGGDEGDALSGRESSDTLLGGAGNDSIDGGEDDDRLLGESGRDTIFGGAGSDLVDGGAGDDVISGGTGRDDLFGGAGADVLSGEGGNDTLSGGDDGDTLSGGAGFDLLIGGEGADTISGGENNDIIFGAGGDDLIEYEAGGGADTLRDFVSGAASEDIIRLLGFGAQFDSFAEVLAAATDDGADTTIDFGGGDMLIIRNVIVADLSAADFAFG